MSQAWTTIGGEMQTAAKLNNVDTVPAGTIAIWTGLIANIPSGWKICDGTLSTPDLRSKFVRGAPGTSEAGGTGGSDTVTLVTANLPAHTHIRDDMTAGTGVQYGQPASSNVSGSVTSYSVGGGGAHNNMPSYYQVIFIMKT